jgi:hypothetical protein
VVVLRLLYPDVTPQEAAEVVLPHDAVLDAGDGALPTLADELGAR